MSSLIEKFALKAALISCSILNLSAELSKVTGIESKEAIIEHNAKTEILIFFDSKIFRRDLISTKLHITPDIFIFKSTIFDTLFCYSFKMISVVILQLFLHW